MADGRRLLPIPLNAPVDGHGAITLPLRDELQSAELLLEIGQIPVVTQNSQEGEFFHNRLLLLLRFD
jgi:hypothetical protein